MKFFEKRSLLCVWRIFPRVRCACAHIFLLVLVSFTFVQANCLPPPPMVFPPAAGVAVVPSLSDKEDLQETTVSV